MDGLAFFHADASHLGEFLGLPGRGTDRATMERRFARGDLCLGVRREGRLIAWSWVAFGSLQFGSYAKPLAPDEAYLFDAYVVPEHRGRNLAGYLRSTLYRELAAAGRRTLYSLSLRSNAAALRFKEKLGARIVDRGISIKFFNRWRVGTRARPERLRRLECAP